MFKYVVVQYLRFNIETETETKTIRVSTKESYFESFQDTLRVKL